MRDAMISPGGTQRAQSGAVEIRSTIDFLVGTWKVDREIEDHRSRTHGSFHGTATVVAAEPGQRPGERRACYVEAGQLRFGAHRAPASRRLEYVRGDGDLVQVRFADGRPFIDLDLRSGQWQAVHQCGADRYELTTTVLSAGVIAERWHVQGPAKDYDAVTTLTRNHRGPRQG